MQINEIITLLDGEKRKRTKLLNLEEIFGLKFQVSGQKEEENM